MICLFVLDEQNDDWAPGGAAKWWLHHSLQHLKQDIEQRGGTLVLQRGDSSQIIAELVSKLNISHVFWNRAYDPRSVSRDTDIKAGLKASGVVVDTFNGTLLHEPWTVKTKTGGVFKVFTPFWRAELALPEVAFPLPSPDSIPGIEKKTAVASDSLEDWDLLPTKPDWAAGLRDEWQPGEDGAHTRLSTFLMDGVDDYAAGRDRMGHRGTSRLSPHLHWGEISPRQIWHATRHAAESAGRSHLDGGYEAFLREVGWRDFSYNLLFAFPQLPTAPIQEKFADFPWRTDKAALEAWQSGNTGYPIVDAAMRELYETGWMHNRARMIVGSFLVKHLLLPWQAGEAWFWDTLVDADLASNAAGWQWIAGCGADAAPYFRVFNPILQGEKFDGDGAYVRRWVPEIAGLPDKFIHSPWTAPNTVLRKAEISLGKTYPHPIVEHGFARNRALGALKSVSGDSAVQRGAA